jgi:hypothetical protein
VQAYVDQGRDLGLIEGEAKGVAKTLLRQLQRRFGEVRGDIVERIRTAKLDQLDDWSDRILDAKTPDDVFGADRRH